MEALFIFLVEYTERVRHDVLYDSIREFNQQAMGWTARNESNGDKKYTL